MKDEASEKEEEQKEEEEYKGNGVNINDLVTKDELTVKLDALSAKIDALIKENNDLKDKNEQLQDKYENQDFGTIQKRGVQSSNVDANETFDSYSKQFM